MLSIIVPCYNRNEMTTECIQSVMENTQDYEIIIIDNGSDPPFKPPFSGFNEIRVIRNEENKGFPVAVNQGIRKSKGDTIILLNNDVVVTPGSLNHLAAWLESDQVEVTEFGDKGPSYVNGSLSFDIVGPTTNYCAGLQRVQLPSYQNIDELNQEADALFESSRGEGEEVNWVIGFCMAFKKSLYDEIGPFDESLWPCSGEEIDFCYRSKEKGFSVGIARDVYVHHEGSVTFRDMEDAGQLEYEKVCARNDKHLAEKWGADFWQNQAIAINDENVPTSGLNLNLGCGFAHAEGYVNIDNRVEVEPDLVCDVTGGLPYGDSEVDSIRAYDFLEHISPSNVIGVMDEIWRVLKHGGTFRSSTPDAERGQAAFQDPTHLSFWVENSWLYYSKPELRALCGIKADFKINHLECVETGRGEYHINVTAEAVK